MEQAQEDREENEHSGGQFAETSMLMMHCKEMDEMKAQKVQ